MATKRRPANSPAPRAPRSLRSEVVVVFPSSPRYLPLIRRLAEWFAEDCRFCGKERSRIALAVVEATTNIIRHAYGGKTTHPITLRIRENRSSLVLEFLDRGRAVNPGDVVPRRSERLEPGGLGLRILETCVDDFRYEKRSHGGARLILRKRRGPPSPPAQETGQA